MLNDFYQYTIGSHFLSAIINSDCSGLDDEDERLLDDFLANLPPAAVGGSWDVQEGEAEFARCEVTDLYADCLTVKLHFHNPEA